jgi:phage-related protein
MRTDAEEIDGRDGDEVTPLGFAAYDKPITIGLKGDYDIDEVINYFNSSGQITFSNEIDKFYKFAIYDAIDFNRLVRFRTANVNIHVQPFKYPIDEQPLTFYADEVSELPILFQAKIRNKGNYKSKPIYEITGAGDISINIDGARVLKLTLNEEMTAIIDTLSMNITDLEGNYLNRQATGDYSDLEIPVGLHEVTVTGTITRLKIYNYSRWI